MNESGSKYGNEDGREDWDIPLMSYFSMLFFYASYYMTPRLESSSARIIQTLGVQGYVVTGRTLSSRFVISTRGGASIFCV